ncbi:MAG: recombinase family protein [Polyangia bacterium]
MGFRSTRSGKSSASQRIEAGSSRKFFVDGGFSAKKPIGPRFSEDDARNQKIKWEAIAAVLVTKLDRFTRSLRSLPFINEDLLEPFCCNLVAIRDGINV